MSAPICPFIRHREPGAFESVRVAIINRLLRDEVKELLLLAEAAGLTRPEAIEKLATVWTNEVHASEFRRLAMGIAEHWERILHPVIVPELVAPRHRPEAPRPAACRRPVAADHTTPPRPEDSGTAQHAPRSPSTT